MPNDKLLNHKHAKDALKTETSQREKKKDEKNYFSATRINASYTDCKRLIFQAFVKMLLVFRLLPLSFTVTANAAHKM